MGIIKKIYFALAIISAIFLLESLLPVQWF